MYKASLQPDVTVDDNRKLWKIKMPLKVIFWMASSSGVILTKDKIAKKETSMVVRNVFYVIMMR
jgi:hypothetical protein